MLYYTNLEGHGILIILIYLSYLGTTLSDYSHTEVYKYILVTLTLVFTCFKVKILQRAVSSLGMEFLVYLSHTTNSLMCFIYLRNCLNSGYLTRPNYTNQSEILFLNKMITLIYNTLY